MQKAPEGDTVRLKNQVCKSKVILAMISLLHCGHTTEMHSSGVTGWMQIGCDSPWAMIYWVIGATHEWRYSTTRSKSPILLFIPRVRLSPSLSVHSTLSLQSCSTISKHSSMSGYIHLFSLTFPSILKDLAGMVYWTSFRLWKLKEKCGARDT